MKLSFSLLSLFVDASYDPGINLVDCADDYFRPGAAWPLESVANAGKTVRLCQNSQGKPYKSGFENEMKPHFVNRIGIAPIRITISDPSTSLPLSTPQPTASQSTRHLELRETRTSHNTRDRARPGITFATDCAEMKEMLTTISIKHRIRWRLCARHSRFLTGSLRIFLIISVSLR